MVQSLRGLVIVLVQSMSGLVNIRRTRLTHNAFMERASQINNKNETENLTLLQPRISELLRRT